MSYAHASLHVGGSEILVQDDALEAAELRALLEALDSAPFAGRESAIEEAREFTHHACEFRPDFVQNIGVATRIRLLLPVLGGVGDERITRSYCNFVRPSDQAFPHRDSSNEGDFTAVLFAVQQWRPSWAGELVFLEPRSGQALAVEARPARLVVFPGNVLHCGQPPSVAAEVRRLTVVFKFEPCISRKHP